MSRKFYVTSLDIFDTLMAKGRRIGVGGLISMSKQKCLLISKEDNKQKLAEYVSQLPFDYDDIVNLYEIIESDSRREKLSTSTIKKKVNYSQVHEAINTLSSSLTLAGEKAELITNPNSTTIMIDYEYKEIDFGKATMLQETTKKDRIELFLGKDNVTDIRIYSNPKCKELVDKIIKEIERAENEKLDVEEIELSSLASSDKRNLFFFTLINGIKGLQLDDVSGVKISRLTEEHDNLNIDSIDDEGEEETVPTEKLAGFIKEVALKGKGLLFQQEYKDFVKKGFFISDLIWKSLDSSVEPNLLVEFEAGFADQQLCKGFEYSVKGAYSFKKNDSSFSTTRKQLTEPDKLKYRAKLEEAARISKQEVSHDET